MTMRRSAHWAAVPTLICLLAACGGETESSTTTEAAAAKEATPSSESSVADTAPDVSASDPATPSPAAGSLLADACTLVQPETLRRAGLDPSAGGKTSKGVSPDQTQAFCSLSWTRHDAEEMIGEAIPDGAPTDPIKVSVSIRLTQEFASEDAASAMFKQEVARFGKAGTAPMLGDEAAWDEVSRSLVVRQDGVLVNIGLHAFADPTRDSQAAAVVMTEALAALSD